MANGMNGMDSMCRKNFMRLKKQPVGMQKKYLRRCTQNQLLKWCAILVRCSPGIAVTEKPSHGLVPRCGVPASTWEVDTDCIYDTRDMSYMNNTLNATRCNYSSIKYYRSESDADYTPCPDCEVAIGFFWNAKDLTYDQWRAETSANDVYDNMERKN